MLVEFQIPIPLPLADAAEDIQDQAPARAPFLSKPTEKQLDCALEDESNPGFVAWLWPVQ